MSTSNKPRYDFKHELRGDNFVRIRRIAPLAADYVEELEHRVKVLTDELVRVKSICLRELGIGIVDENVLNQTVI